MMTSGRNDYSAGSTWRVHKNDARGSNIRTCAARSSVWLPSIARLQS
jgi:hypothetical protein